MSGQINLELLIRMQADQAKRELAAVQTGARNLAAATGQLGKGAGVAAAGLAGTGASAGVAAGEMTSFVATLGRTSTAIAGVQNSVTGLTTNFAGQTAAMLEARREAELWQATLEETRARFNPLFAASRQYEQDLRDIAEAERMGAISAREAAAARERAAATMAPVANGVIQNARMAGAANANLIAQWNDIGMMAVAGQSPLMLALQQGTQVTQVFDDLRAKGQPVLKSLGASFLGLLNPINLVTIGVIGFGAAALQWLMKMGPATKSAEEHLDELTATLGRVKERMDLLGNTRLAERFGNLADPIRGLTSDLLALDRAAELRQLQDTLASLTGEALDPSLWQRLNTGGESFTPGAVFGTSGKSDIAAVEERLRAENYARFGAANTYDDFQARQKSIMERAKSGDVEGVTSGIVDLGKAMTGGGPITGLSEEAQKLFQVVGQLAVQTAEVEAHFNGSAKAAAATREASSMSRELTQSAELSRAMVLYGEDSAQVEAVRTQQARDALQLRLQEAGVVAGSAEEAKVLADFEAERLATLARAEQERRIASGQIVTDLEQNLALSTAILTYGEDSAEVEAVRAAHAEKALEARLNELQATPELIARAKELLAADQARTAAAKAAEDARRADEVVQSQNDRLTELRLELSLIGQTEVARARALALLRAEQEIRDRKIDTTSARAEELRAGALERVDLERTLDRISDAWGRVDNAAGSAIDNMVDALTGGGKDALRAAADDMLQMVKELSLNNPLKNAILGTNLPTLSDVGGIGGIFGRLFGGEAAVGVNVSAMNAPSMAVTTPMVNITAGAISGLPGAVAGQIGAGSGVTMGGSLPGSPDIQKQIWDFFSAKGLQPHQVAAVLGHAGAESAFNPQAVGDGGNALGLFQWNNRAPQMLNAIGGQQNLGNVQAQLEFAWHELMTSEKGAFQRLKSSGNVYEATHAFSGFERPQGYDPANPSSTHQWDRRLAGAEAAMAKFEGTTVSAQAQLGTLGTGAQQLGTGLEGFGGQLGGLLQGIGAKFGPGGTFIADLITGGLGLLGGGFERGGWTGSGATTDVAGVVHAEEYVFDAAATRRIGVANLEALRRGAMKGYRDGGYVVGARPPASAGRAAGDGQRASAADHQQVEFNINVSGTGDAQVAAGVRAAISAAFDEHIHAHMPGLVKMIVNDEWGS